MCKNLKEIRKKNNKTQEEIAKILNVSQTNYSKIESGKVTMNTEQLVTLSKYFKVSSDYLIGLTD